MGLVLAFSGGKDSTAAALRLAETGECGTLLFNIVGGEFDDLLAHVDRIRVLTGWPLVPTTAGSGLHEQIREYQALPNQWQRWCTRKLKIEPTIAYLKANPGSVLAVGLRADEPERTGLYGDYADYRYPLREWGWGLPEVEAYLNERGVCIPRRTNCPLCYGQRLAEWWMLWKEHPEKWAEGERLEAETSHTFRSPGRDTWPAGMAELRQRFETGDTPKGIKSLPLFNSYEVTDGSVCRVCSL